MALIYIVLVLVVTMFLAWIINKLVGLFMTLRVLNRALVKFPHKTPIHWIWGNLTDIRSPEDVALFIYKMTLKHGRVFSGWLSFVNPLVFVNHPDTIKQAIKHTSTKPTSGVNKGYSLIEPWIGDGLILASGEKWERNRKLLTPAFHFDILKPYVKVYNEAAEKCATKFSALIKEEQGRSVDMWEPIGLLTLDVMLSCAFSFKTDIQAQGHPYEKAVTRLMELMARRAMNPLYQLDFVWKWSAYGKEFQALCDYTHQVSGDVITARQHSLRNKADDQETERYLDFLDILLTAKDEHGLGLSVKEIRDEVDTFMFAGHDTTKASISWCLYCLAKYPEEQKKVYEEINQVFGDNDQLSWNDVLELTYTSLFIKEVMRMYPPVPQIARIVTEPMTLDGVELPVGTSLEICIYALNHNPLVWENPEEFNPDRFSTEKFADHDPYSFIPFSAGSRNCIGQVFALKEIKTVLACLVRRFEFEHDADHEKYVVLQSLAVLTSKGGIKVKITERNV